MISKLVGLTLVLAFGCALATKTSYKGYKLYNIYSQTQEQADLIAQLEHNPDVSDLGLFQSHTVQVRLESISSLYLE